MTQKLYSGPTHALASNDNDAEDMELLEADATIAHAASGQQDIFTVSPEHAGSRLDKYLASQLPEHSRTRLKALVQEGAVSVDNQIETDPNRKLQSGTRIHVVVPDALPAEPQAEAIPLNIVYEDADLIVIDKPAGLVVHPAAGHATGTLVNALIAHCGESLSGIGGVKRPGIVHRLDKDTTGLLVIAKNDRAHKKLAEQFADHGRSGPLQRSYRAIVWGVPERKYGTIDAAIDRSTKHRDRMMVVRGEKGRQAITHYEVVETFKGADGMPVASLVACHLETGRTHQIRVHMSHLGHPLIGDTLYGSGFRTKSSLLPDNSREIVEKFARQALHAAELGFEHPKSGEELHFASEDPEDFALLLAMLRG